MCVCVISERVKHQYKGLKKSVVKPIFHKEFAHTLSTIDCRKIKIRARAISGACFSRKIFFFSE